MWTKCVAVGPLAGAPGIEPGNGGIKIRCLTAWLRPNRDCLLRVTPWGFKARKPEPDRRTRSERLGECSHVRALRSIEGHLVGDGDARCNARFEERDVQRGSPPKHRDRLEATASSALHLGRGGLPSAGALVIHSCPQPSIASRGWFDTPLGPMPMGSRDLVLESGAPTRVMAQGRHRGPARGWWRSCQLPGALRAKVMDKPALFPALPSTSRRNGNACPKAPSCDFITRVPRLGQNLPKISLQMCPAAIGPFFQSAAKVSRRIEHPLRLRDGNSGRLSATRS